MWQELAQVVSTILVVVFLPALFAWLVVPSSAWLKVEEAFEASSSNKDPRDWEDWWPDSDVEEESEQWLS